VGSVPSKSGDHGDQVYLVLSNYYLANGSASPDMHAKFKGKEEEGKRGLHGMALSATPIQPGA